MKLLIILTAFFLALGNLHVQAARPIPLHLAEAAVTEAKKEFSDDQQSRYRFIEAYCIAFLDTWRFGDRIDRVTRSFSDDASHKGYDAGVRAATGEPEGRRISPSDFGYLIKVLEGTYDGHFEKSEFTIAETGERFHMNFGRVSGFDLPEGTFKVRAWVSPETLLGFGHFGQWKQEIILIRIMDPEDEDG